MEKTEGQNSGYSKAEGGKCGKKSAFADAEGRAEMKYSRREKRGRGSRRVGQTALVSLPSH
jgi:hypothetical protein